MASDAGSTASPLTLQPTAGQAGVGGSSSRTTRPSIVSKTLPVPSATAASAVKRSALLRPDLDSLLHCTDIAICRSLRKRKRKHGATDLRDKAHLIPPEQLDLLIHDLPSSDSSSSPSPPIPCPSAEVARITDRLLDQDGDRSGSSSSSHHNKQPLLQVTLLQEGFKMKLLPISNNNNNSTSSKLNGTSVACNEGTDGQEVMLPYDDACDLMQDIDSGLTPAILMDFLVAKFPSRLSADDYGQEVEILLKDLRPVPSSSSSTSSQKADNKKNNNNNNHNAVNTISPNSTDLSSSGSCSISSRTVRLRASNVTMAKIVRHKIMSLNQKRVNAASENNNNNNNIIINSSLPANKSSINQTKSTVHQQNPLLTNQLSSHVQPVNQLSQVQPQLQQNHDLQQINLTDAKGPGNAMEGNQMTVQVNGHCLLSEDSSQSSDSKLWPLLPLVRNNSTTTNDNKTPEQKPVVKSRSKGKDTSAKDKDKESSCWATEADECATIESQVILNSCSSEPLCLDPSPVVHLIHNRLLACPHRGTMGSITGLTTGSRKTQLKERKKRLQLLKSLRNDSHANEEDERLFLASNPVLRLSSFLHRKKQEPRVPRPPHTRTLRKSVSSATSNASAQSASQPEGKLDMEKVSEEITRLSSRLRSICAHLSRVNQESAPLNKIEEYVMEYDSAPNPSPGMNPVSIPAVTCVTIFHRQLDDVFFGQLFVDRPGLPASSSRSAIYRLGTRDAAKKYLEQFKEILTENGRKFVRITRTAATASGATTTSNTGTHHPPVPQSPAPPVVHHHVQQQQQQQVMHHQQTQPQVVANSNNNNNLILNQNNMNQQTHQVSVQTGITVLSSSNPAIHIKPQAQVQVQQQVQQQQQQQPQFQQIHLQPQIATKVILPPVVQAGVDQLIQQQQQQQHLQQQQHVQQVHVQPHNHQPQQQQQHIKIQPQMQGKMQQITAGTGGQTQGMICAMIPASAGNNSNNATTATIQSLLQSAVHSSGGATGTPFTTHPQIVSGGQVTAGTTQLRSIPGTNSWLVLPPGTATNQTINSSTGQTIVQSGTQQPHHQVPQTVVQGQQQQQTSQQPQQQSYRPVHVILWPQQQPPAAPAQHIVVSSHNNTTGVTVTGTLVTNSMSSASPSVTVSLLNSGNTGATPVIHLQQHNLQPQTQQMQTTSQGSQ